MEYPQEKVKPYGQEGKKVEQVERMFDHIAPAYDRLSCRWASTARGGARR